MRIKIDVKKIKDAPIDDASSLDKAKINKFKQEIMNGNPTTYLVSGYRGVGKTSFIRTLISKINLELTKNEKVEAPINESLLEKIKTYFSKSKKDNVSTDKSKNLKVFVHLNVGKYNGFSNILRNLIREVYWSIINSDKSVQSLFQKNPILLLEIELIYARTFQEVELKQTDFQNEQKDKIFVFSSDFRKLIVRLSTFLLGSVTLINYIKEGPWITYTIPIILLILLLFSFEYIKKKSKSHSIEFNRKTFYDDEIAEFQLTRIISKLADLGIELMFVIDELDKIEKEEDVNSFISDLKPLMLSGDSNYILIFGQKMLYKYLMSDITDNGMLSSVFSRNIHIPLLNKAGFEKYFISLVGETEYENEVVKKYLDSKILTSNRIFRKFINLIRNDIIYDKEGKTYLKIDENDKFMLTNSKISLVIYQVEDEIRQDTKDKVEEGVIDFFVSNLYIAVKNMRRMQFISFNVDDILESKDFLEEEFASAYMIYIRKNIQSIIDKMVNERLLEIEAKKETDINEETSNYEVRYRWTTNAEISSFDNKEFAFFNEFIQFERWVKDFAYQAHKYILDISIGNNKSLFQDIRSLVSNELVSTNVLEDFKVINNARNKIAHGENLNDIEKKSLITLNRDLDNLKRIIFEEVMTSAVCTFNSNSELNIRSNKLKNNIDALVENVAFEFKYFNNESNFEKYLNKIQPIDYIDRVKEFRVLVLLEMDVNEAISNKIRVIEEKTNIKIKLIKDIQMFELQDFLKLNIEYSVTNNR